MKSVPCFTVVLLTILSPVSVHADTPISAAVTAGVADPRRPADQVKLDPARKPAQLLAFAELKAGDRVADFMPGNGYFTRIMSGVVGANGHVYAFLPAEQLANCAPSEVAGTKALQHDPSYANVSVLSGATAISTWPRSMSSGRRKTTMTCMTPSWGRRT
jgi:predicted methyltransferase